MYIEHTYECTSRSLKKFITVVPKLSELYLAVPPPTLQAAPREGWSGDSDL
jgi:hypothetical protein